MEVALLYLPLKTN